ncbi:EutN/CcmL family microcompartment protein [candidate division KSB1 bacterium]
MHLGRVLGNVTATKKYDDLKGNKFMIIEPTEHNLKKKRFYTCGG